MTKMCGKTGVRIIFLNVSSVFKNAFLQAVPRKRLIVPLCRIGHVQGLVWRAL